MGAQQIVIKIEKSRVYSHFFKLCLKLKLTDSQNINKVSDKLFSHLTAIWFDLVHYEETIYKMMLVKKDSINKNIFPFSTVLNIIRDFKLK